MTRLKFSIQVFVIMSAPIGMMLHCMDDESILLKKESSNVFVMPINSAELNSLKGTHVLWKQNENNFHFVRLGNNIAGTSLYQIYLKENKGRVCDSSELYQYKK